MVFEDMFEDCRVDISLSEIIDDCSAIKADRHTVGVVLKLVEEVGEISTEANIQYFGAYKEPGKDGVVGECVDALICICDILNKEGVDHRDLLKIIENKMKKWKENADGKNNR